MTTPTPIIEALEPFARCWAVAFKPFDGKWPDDTGIAPLMPSEPPLAGGDGK